MKLKSTIISVVACLVALVMTLSFTACNPTENTEATITAIEILESISVDTGDTKNVITQIKYSDGTTKKTNDSSIVWKSSDEAIATVTRGIVSGKARGTANITATVGEGDKAVTSNVCAVTVHSLEFTVTGEGVKDGVATIDLGQTLQLTATVKQDGVAVENAEIVWSSSSASFVTVSNTGLIKGLNPGKSTVKAIYNNREATVEVTVNELAGAAKMTDKEQNKAPANAWGYWHDQGWNWSNTTVEQGAVYTEPYTEPAGDGYIGAGKVNITFSVDQYSSMNGTAGPNEAAIQLFYRSAGEEGKLITNHNYELTLKLETTASGTVSLNDYTKLPENPFAGVELGEITEKENAQYKFEVEAGKVNTLTVQFRHGDSGAIYADGKYSNVESAIQLCLGLLSAPKENESDDNVVKVTVYEICYKDLGAAEKEFKDNPENLPGYQAPVELPDMGDAQAVALPAPELQNNPDKYVVTPADEGKSYNVKYTDVAGGSYEDALFDITGTNAAECNTFAVTIKNNGEESISIRFDINAAQAHNDNGSQDIVVAAVAAKGNPKTDTTWGGTPITVAGGDEVTLYLTYDVKLGAPDKLRVCFNTHIYQDTATYSGDVTISGFTFAKLEDTRKTATANDVNLVKEGDAVYFVVTGKCTNYTLDELKAAHGLYLQSSDWDESKNVTAAEEDLTVTLDGEGNYEIKWNITNVAAGSYMAHLTPAFLGTQYGDLFHESGFDPVINNGGKTYDYVNKSFDGGAWSRYCLTITVDE